MSGDFPYPKSLERYPTLRQSLLSHFDSCGLSSSFETEYRRGWSTSYQARGQIFHRFAGACLKEMHSQDEERIPIDAALGILRDVLRQDEVDRVCPACGSVEILPGVSPEGERRCRDGHVFETEWVNVPLKEVKDLYWCAIKWAKDNEWEIGKLVDVELRLHAEVRYQNRVVGGTVPRELTGAIDALFWGGPERLIVLDWKDTWAVPGPQDVSFKGYFQQRFYAWLLFSRFPRVKEVVLREFYVRYSEPREAVVDREMMPEIEAELAALAERFDRAYDEQMFTPTPGKWCNNCIRPAKCPIPMYAREEGRITDAARAADMAGQLVKAEAIVKQARASLRAYTDVNGPVPFADKKGTPRAFGYVEQLRTRKPTKEELAEAIAEAGSASGLNLDSLYVETKGTKFGAHVAVEPTDPTEAEAEIVSALEESIAASAEGKLGSKVA